MLRAGGIMQDHHQNGPLTAGDAAMKPKTFLKSVILGAGACILLIGMAIAQTAPAPAPAPTAPAASAPASPPPAPASREERRAKMQAIAAECRNEVTGERGSDRREAMRKCVETKREKAGLNGGPGRRDQAERGEGRKEMRQETRKEERRAHIRACREELKDQRFTEAERRAAMQGCIAKRDPQMGKMLVCRNEAEGKKLEPKTREFRQFMRECRGRA